MKNGISTACLYPMESEKSLQILLDFGYRSFEYFVNAPCEMEKSFLKLIKDMANHYGASFKSIHPFSCSMEGILFFSNYDRRFIDGVDFYKRYFEAANYLGADIFVLHGQMRSRNGVFSNPDESYFENFRVLSNAAKEFGVQLCQENVRSYRSENIEFLKAMKDYLKSDVSFVLDVKQAVMTNNDPIEMIKAMGDRLKHIHLSDNNSTSPCLLPGEGNFDISQFVFELNKIGYKGDLFTEVYRHSFNELNEIEKSYLFMENLLKSPKT